MSPSFTNANAAASDLLERAWVGKSFPVDPVVIAKRLGLDVIVARLPDRLAGALIKEADKDPVILLSETDSKNRKRFTCAHELGHYVYRQENGNGTYEYLDLRGEHSSTGLDPEEVFANQFAAALLMPEHEVRSLAAQGKSRAVMAMYFGVSDDAMRIRMKTLHVG